MVLIHRPIDFVFVSKNFKTTVKLGDKEPFDKTQIGVKELLPENAKSCC